MGFQRYAMGVGPGDPEVLPDRGVEQVGVLSHQGDAGAKIVDIAFDSERLTRADVVAALEAIGFAPDDEP